MKTLVADDDEDSLSLLQDLLPQWGHEVIMARDGEEALTLMLQPGAPRLAVLDWVMPRLNGVQLCRRLRERDTPTPIYVILLTSRNRTEDLVHALEAGADDFVTKPFVFDELRARLQVGCRILGLQAQLCECERLRAVLQTTGAVCHEMNQPLQTVLTASQLLAMSLPPDDPNHDLLVTLREGIERLGEFTRGMMRLAHAHTKPYMHGSSHIIDFGVSSVPPEAPLSKTE